MAGGFSIGVAADTKAFEAAVKSGIIDPLDDAQDALQDLGKSGEKAGDGLSDATKDAQRDLTKLGREAKDAGNDVERGMKDAERATDKVGKAGKEAGDDIERGMKDAQSATARQTEELKQMTAKMQAETAKLKAEGKDTFSPAAESSRAFKEEATSNLSEVVSSFDGSAQSITDLFQGTLGGIITELGPLGLAAGAAGAVAVGILGQSFVQAGEDADAFKERVKSMTQEFISDFTDASDPVSKLDEKLRDWANDNEKYGLSLVQLRKDTKAAGVAFDETAKAIATGTLPEVKKATKAVEDHIDALREEERAARAGSTGETALSKSIGEKADRLQNDVMPALKQQKEALENAAAAEEALAGAQGMSVKQYEAYVDAQNKAKEANEAFKESMKDLAAESGESTAEVLNNAALSADQYIAGMQKRQAANQQFYDNLKAVGKSVPDEVFQYLQGRGTDFSQEIATYLSATPAQQAEILDGWKKAAGSGTEIDGPTLKAKADASDVDKKTAEKGREKKDGPTSKLKADASAVDKKVAEKGKEKKDGTTLKLRADTDAVDKAIARYREKTYHATVKFKADTSNVTAALNRLDGRHISVIVDQKVGKKVA